jgi:hypothetical protein
VAAIKGPVRKYCVTCGESFAAGSGAAKFCSDACHIQGNTQKSDRCWLWLGGRDKDGYGIIRFSGNRRVKAHRAAYEMSKGPIPKGMMVCHSCDNPGCVRPDHLFLGTALINKEDCVSKGRHVHGNAVYWKAKLREMDVLAIIQDDRHRAIVAGAYGVTPELIDAIRKRKIWKHLSA